VQKNKALGCTQPNGYDQYFVLKASRISGNNVSSPQYLIAFHPFPLPRIMENLAVR
jgi:hypothetical protein